MRHNEYWDDTLDEDDGKLPVPEGPYERELEVNIKYKNKQAEKNAKIAKIYNYLDYNDLLKDFLETHTKVRDTRVKLTKRELVRTIMDAKNQPGPKDMTNTIEHQKVIIERLKIAAINAQRDAIKMVMDEAEAFVKKTVHSANMMLQFELKISLATHNVLKDILAEKEKKIEDICRKFAK